MPLKESTVVAGESLSAALKELPSLSTLGPARDRLWMTLRGVTTRTATYVVPCGSSRPVRITADQSGDELIAAWEWLQRHEVEARAMSASDLYMALRGAATRSHNGSARRALSDELCGLTQVPSGTWVEVRGDEQLERLA